MFGGQIRPAHPTRALWIQAPPFLKGRGGRGFERHAARLRNGSPVQRNTRPARWGGFYAAGNLQMCALATTEIPLDPPFPKGEAKQLRVHITLNRDPEETWGVFSTFLGMIQRLFQRKPHPMFTQTLKPDQCRITLDIPESYLHRTLEVMIVPVPERAIRQSKADVIAFFAKHQVQLRSDWKLDRGGLPER